MTEQQKNKIIEELKIIILTFKDAGHTTNDFRITAQIRNDMNQNFLGMQTALKILTQTEWRMGFDGKTYTLIEIENGNEIKHNL